MVLKSADRKTVTSKSAPRLVLAFVMVLAGLGLVVFGLRGVLEEEVFVRTPNMLIRAKVADDEAERTLGLSGRDGLDGNRAMLFIFDKPDIHSIWMKDMKFAIDIVWLDEDKKVVSIDAGVKPDTYPKKFKPDTPSKYVVEFAEGRASELGIKVDQILSW
ncbi:MAG: DUF192 domain-containing protein [Patescibacteria group bacterium]